MIRGPWPVCSKWLSKHYSPLLQAGEGQGVRAAARKRQRHSWTNAKWTRGRVAAAFFVLAGLAMMAGCGPSEPSQRAPSPSLEGDAPPPPPLTKASATSSGTAAPQPTTSSTPSAPPPAPPQPPQTVKTEAAVGAGAKGHGYGSGPIATPASAFFRTRERIAFEIQIPKNMQLYKATEGRAPQSHEEFMQKIIKEGQINLPVLPEGHRYVYDPKTEELMIEKPAE